MYKYIEKIRKDYINYHRITCWIECSSNWKSIYLNIYNYLYLKWHRYLYIQSIYILHSGNIDLQVTHHTVQVWLRWINFNHFIQQWLIIIKLGEYSIYIAYVQKQYPQIKKSSHGISFLYYHLICIIFFIHMFILFIWECKKLAWYILFTTYLYGVLCYIWSTK